jgi:hypothetical protein
MVGGPPTTRLDHRAGIVRGLQEAGNQRALECGNLGCGLFETDVHLER